MQFRYQVNEWPSQKETLLFTLQWLLIMAPMVIIMGKVGAVFYSPSPDLQQLYLQKLFFVTGTAMFAQLAWGHRLPIIVGPASVLLIGIAASTQAGEQAIYSSIAIGGVLVTLISTTGLLAQVSRLFTTRVIGVVLLLIAFTFLPTVIKLITTGTDQVFRQLIFAAGLVAAMLAGQRSLPELFRSTIIIWALLLGSAAWYMLFPAPAPYAAVTKNEAWSLPSLELVFDPAVLLSFVFCYLALLVNELGSVQTTAKLVSADAGKLSGRGVFLTGLGNILAGWLGVIGPVSYSLSPGVLIATRCASRYPLMLAAAMVAGMAFLPDIIGLFAYIPSAVIGCLLFYMLCSQISASFGLLSPVMASYTFDTGLIIGVPLMLGVAVSFLPAPVTAEIPALVRPLLSNGFVVGVAAALLLEYVLLKQR